MPISAYLDIEKSNVEYKTKFLPNPKLKLMARDIRNLQSPLDAMFAGNISVKQEAQHD
ncbi:MAG: hypothetical protein WCO53_00760 [Deltaproteobacteria bacterium]